MMEPKYQANGANGHGMGMAGNGGDGNGMAMETEWEDWRQGECLLPQLVGKFYDQQQWCDVRFCLADGSVVAAHKLVLAITSSVFEGMFFGPLADKNLSQASSWNAVAKHNLCNNLVCRCVLRTSSHQGSRG